MARFRYVLAVCAALLAIKAAPALAAEATLTLRLPDRGALTIRAVSNDRVWSFRTFAGRAEQQRLRVESEATELLPWLGDADADGTADLWVPINQGNVNTVYRVFLMNPNDGQFSAAGEVGGIAFAHQGADLVAVARSSCCAFTYTFYTFQPAGQADETASIEVTLNEAGRPESCSTSPNNPMPRALVQRYCRLAEGDLPRSFGPSRN